MSIEGLHLRIEEVITYFSGGSQTAFARRVGISQSTLNRNLREKDDKLLMTIASWVLLALPDLSCNWLLMGEGEMLLPKECARENPHDGANQVTDSAPAVDDSIIEHLHYVIECQKHTLEIQTRLLEIHSKDFLKNAAALGSIGAAQSQHGHSD